MKAHNKASAWFDELYKKNKNTHGNIPWARLEGNPLLKTYIEEHVGHSGKALVIGCGLGDDAIALEMAGYGVTAIDVSQSALEVAKERFPDSKVNFERQDIFDMPSKYTEYFDFVFESLTIQSLPVEFREKMIQAVAKTVAIDGDLLLVAHKRQALFTGPPWSLELHEVDLFKTHGLTEISHDLHTEDSPISNTRFRVHYRKINE